MTQANESDDDRKDNSPSAGNPYQPPVDANVNNLVRPRSAVPGGKFWAVAVTAFVFALLITIWAQGITSPILLALPAAVVRVCLIYWRRSSLGMEELASIPLLFTSTLVALGLELSCVIAFGGICTGGLFVLDGIVHPGYEYTLPLTMALVSAVAGLVAFIVLLVWSIKWAS